ncbi:hypothetical protein I5907_12355 [Panacibacter sp. DH6]|uniref:Outer membrane protein beta-barrel domain-containing protein n=1 Tax=Panacibacter microcysteis TaxID=2793269 RepID=A0A931E4R2_9BACT|nr:hypothetical protein [Panacibacter microcysteis]MBG9377028.1 hypothetical protein [Panacibacter microcysteis]
MRKTLAIVCIFVASSIHAQKSNQYQQVDFSATAGSKQGTLAAAYSYNTRFGKSHKFDIGLGVRNTAYFGTKKDFITAGPARLTRTFTTPFAIFFAGQQESNFDTLVVQRSFVNAVNIALNLGYHFNEKISAGFNIDLVGFSFGTKTNGVFKSNGQTITEPSAKPSAFNLLLTGDHDKGSLNSEFFLRYNLNSRWGIKGVYQFVFVEYQANSVEQTFADGSKNDRFRNKANNFGLGITWQLNK